ncbi:HD domain-containing protein [Demequina sp. TTPB684]|uniref:[protein-PII] uridylyltransferase family protein n=1 Tax=unclassified Demequina TaxID=2620311 RepID=UPI001CF2D11B|nr:MULTISPECIES: HD domain-containing protein [unclassified Demequina]MCB2413175.1 HD domain-containing protein [Demequina sp. TTPB684]UPU89681.1 HD domain-containing protein [Demequina sp. TMPB413]
MGRSGIVRDGSHAEVPHPHGVRDLKRDRQALALALAGVDGRERRQALAQLVFTRLAEHFTAVTGDIGGLTLAAVGSVGRGEAGPHSDLDLVLLHDGTTSGKAAASEVAARLWYPIWDAGLQLDHSTRSLTECRQVASKDLAAAAGLLDLRHVAGDESLAQQARSAILADWRSAARKRLPDLLAASRARAERCGELAYLIEPNIKESRGGLRDYVSLTALAATWLTDRPHGAVDDAAQHLLDVRDAVHTVSGRAAHIVGRHVAQEVADALHMEDTDALLASIAEAGRTIAYAVDSTERGARRALEKSGVGSRAFLAKRRGAAPRHVPVARGLIDVDGELALAPGYAAEDDAVLPLRAAAAAASTGLTFTPSLLETFSRCPELGSPWPHEALDRFTELLRHSHHLLGVWEALDVAGQIVSWLPEWAPVRNRPQRNPFHLYTVDRHQIEAVVLAGKFRKHVPDPDLLLYAALFHDIGKQAGVADHSEYGASLIPGIAARMGLSDSHRDAIQVLVCEHLTLASFATTRDVEDNAVAAELVERLGGSSDLFEALRALTEADAKAASPKAWTAWREQLIDTLTARVRATLAAGPQVG